MTGTFSVEQPIDITQQVISDLQRDHRDGQLSQEWLACNPAQGTLVLIHQEFLAIQDRFVKLQGEEYGEFSSVQAREVIIQGVQERQKARLRQRIIFQDALSAFPKSEQGYIESAVHQLQSRGSATDIIFLACIPSHLDAPELWARLFGFTEDRYDEIVPYYKVHEAGLVLASALHRTNIDGDIPDRNGIRRGHDFFSYAAVLVAKGEASDIGQVFIKSERHEGSHSLVDGVSRLLLGLSDNGNPIMEGWAGAMGNDRDQFIPTRIGIDAMIDESKLRNILDDEELNYELLYAAAPKLYRAIYQTIAQSIDEVDYADDKIWTQIAISMFKSGLQIKELLEFETLTNSQKYSLFFTNLIKSLDKDTLIHAYNMMNPY